VLNVENMVQALGPSYTQEELHSTLHRLEVVEGMLGVEDKLIDDDKLKEGDGHNLLHKFVLIHKVSTYLLNCNLIHNGHLILVGLEYHIGHEILSLLFQVYLQNPF
jgi:hypothetical protein